MLPLAVDYVIMDAVILVQAVQDALELALILVV